MNTISYRNAIVEDAFTIHRLAHAIWPEAYGSILSDGQIDYMLRTYYDPEAIRLQMEQQQYHFILQYVNGQPVGFGTWSNEGNSTFKIQKLYILPQHQGSGLGKLLISYLLSVLTAQGAQKVFLNVNRYNKARFFYEKLGFTITGEEDIPIGQNYFMEDYIMTWYPANSSSVT